MTVTIHDTEYKMEMEGTVGLTVIAEPLMNGEPKFIKEDVSTTDEDGKEKIVTREMITKRYELALLYAVFISSNPGIRDQIMFLEFMLALSHQKYAELSLWFWRRWNEIEGIFPQKEEGDGSKKKVSTRESSTSFVSVMVAWIRRIFTRN